MPRRRVVRILRVKLRRLGRDLDRETPAWMQWLTPWGTSFLLHAAAVAALGIFFYATGGAADESGMIGSVAVADGPGDDLTTLNPADQAGDPFPAPDLQESPAFSLAPKDATDSALPRRRCPSNRARRAVPRPA